MYGESACIMSMRWFLLSDIPLLCCAPRLKVSDDIGPIYVLRTMSEMKTAKAKGQLLQTTLPLCRVVGGWISWTHQVDWVSDRLQLLTNRYKMWDRAWRYRSDPPPLVPSAVRDGVRFERDRNDNENAPCLLLLLLLGLY